MVRRGRLRKALTGISQPRTLQACFCAFLSLIFFLTTPSQGAPSLLPLSVEEESKSQTTELVSWSLKDWGSGSWIHIPFLDAKDQMFCQWRQTGPGGLPERTPAFSAGVEYCCALGLVSKGAPYSHSCGVSWVPLRSSSLQFCSETIAWGCLSRTSVQACRNSTGTGGSSFSLVSTLWLQASLAQHPLAPVIPSPAPPGRALFFQLLRPRPRDPGTEKESETIEKEKEFLRTADMNKASLG